MSVKIVLVDDHTILRDGLKLLLQREPEFDVVGEADDGHTAIETIVRLSPDLVVMDLQLPDQTGIVATARILQVCPATRILFLSASAEMGNVREALHAGAHGYLLKGEATAELVRAIRTIVGGGVYLSAHAAMALARSFQTPAPVSADVPLSQRETMVLRLLIDGLRNKEIADRLKISAKSVDTYRARLMKKLGYTHIPELVRYAIRIGLITP